jgi:hypothetical protein
MAEGSKPAHQVADGVGTLFEPARDYREYVSLSSEAVRALHVECGRLTQSFEPLRGLEGHTSEALNLIRNELADLAMSLEAAKGLRRQVSELAGMLDPSQELETQFQELSRALSAFKP